MYIVVTQVFFRYTKYCISTVNEHWTNIEPVFVAATLKSLVVDSSSFYHIYAIKRTADNSKGSTSLCLASAT